MLIRFVTVFILVAQCLVEAGKSKIPSVIDLKSHNFKGLQETRSSLRSKHGLVLMVVVQPSQERKKPEDRTEEISAPKKIKSLSEPQEGSQLRLEKLETQIRKEKGKQDCS